MLAGEGSLFPGGGVALIGFLRTALSPVVGQWKDQRVFGAFERVEGRSKTFTWLGK
jgi:hypothetical protein